MQQATAWSGIFAGFNAPQRGGGAADRDQSSDGTSQGRHAWNGAASTDPAAVISRVRVGDKARLGPSI